MNVNSPLRKRRQSVRPASRKHKENLGDSKSNNVLKDSLLAQLNARVDADASNPFEFSRTATSKAENQATARFSDQHEKIFKSMKPIAVPAVEKETKVPKIPMRPRAPHTPLARSHLPVPLSLKRSDRDAHVAATPSKRRKVEETTLSPSKPALSFSFAATQNSAISTSRTNETPEPTKALIPQPVSNVQSKAHAMPNNSPSRPTSHFSSAANMQSRDQKRLDQKRRTTTQRMTNKSGLPRPGWK